MDKPFDIDRLYRNIAILMKEKGIKVSDMEGIMGVSTGYYSKMVRNRTVLGADALSYIARHLGVTIDFLVNCDMSLDRATDNLFLMMRFLRTLRDDTDGARLHWEAVSASDLEFDYIIDSCEKGNIITDIGFDRNPLAGNNGYYGNNHTSDRIEIDGQVFRVRIDNSIIFLSRLIENIEKGPRTGEQIRYYALDSCSPNQTEAVCDSRSAPELLADLELLYECLKRHAADIQISDSVRGLIDSYILCRKEADDNH